MKGAVLFRTARKQGEIIEGSGRERNGGFVFFLPGAGKNCCIAAGVVGSAGKQQGAGCLYDGGALYAPAAQGPEDGFQLFKQRRVRGFHWFSGSFFSAGGEQVKTTFSGDYVLMVAGVQVVLAFCEHCFAKKKGPAEP
jgi:hypothetical protein